MHIKIENGSGGKVVMTEAPAHKGGYEERILAENEIPGLCRLRIKNTDGERTCCYFAEGLTLLSEAAADGLFTCALLAKILKALKTIREELTSWLISADSIMLLPDTVGLDGEGEVRFCAYPGEAQPLSEGIRSLFEFYEEMSTAGTNANEASDWAAKRDELLLLCCAKEPDIEQMLSLIQKREEDIITDELPKWADSSEKRKRRAKKRRAAAGIAQHIGSFLMPLLGIGVELLLYLSGMLSGFSTAIQAGIFITVALFFTMLTLLMREAEGRHIKAEEAEGMLPVPDMLLPEISFDDTLEYDSDFAAGIPEVIERGHTMLLSELARLESARAVLASRQPEKRKNIYINASPAKVGISGSNASIEVESEYISKEHAVIEADGRGIRVRDEGSTNGTFINGDRLISGQWYPLYEGDELRFADAAYICIPGFSESAKK